MTEKRDNSRYDPLMDTQRLLQGVTPPADEDISLESILAEYGSGAAAPPGDESAAPPAEAGRTPDGGDAAPPAESPPPRPETAQRSRRSKILRFPTPPRATAGEGPEEGLDREDAPSALMPDPDLDDIQPERLFGMEAGPGSPEEAPPAEESAPDQPAAAEAAGPTLTMEDVVASTVDAVQEEQKRRQEKFHQRLEKKRRKAAPKQLKRREPSFRHPLPQVDQEPSLSSAAAQHKRGFLFFAFHR